MTKAEEVVDAATLAAHSGRAGAWIAIDGAAFDVSAFAKRHPGGERVLLMFAGQVCIPLLLVGHLSLALFFRCVSRLQAVLVGAQNARNIDSTRHSCRTRATLFTRFTKTSTFRCASRTKCESAPTSASQAPLR